MSEANLLDPPGRRHDEAGGCRSFHPGQVLRAACCTATRTDDDAEPAAAGDADGRSARGDVARDHSQELRLHTPDRGPGSRWSWQRQPGSRIFYGPYDAQDLLKEHADELDITMVPFQLMVYAENRAQYIPIDEKTDADQVLNISGTELRRRLQEGSRDSGMVLVSRTLSPSCAGRTRRDTSRASRCSSPDSAALANRRLQTH